VLGGRRTVQSIEAAGFGAGNAKAKGGGGGAKKVRTRMPPTSRVSAPLASGGLRGLPVHQLFLQRHATSPPSRPVCGCLQAGDGNVPKGWEAAMTLADLEVCARALPSSLRLLTPLYPHTTRQPP